MPGLEGTSLGRYRLKHRLGKGGMAEVYLATDERMHRDVAIKVVPSSNTEFTQRFQREAQAMGKLSHDHILAAYDYGEQEPWHYLVMQYVKQGTLGDLLKKGPLSLEYAGELLQQIAEALQYAHQQGLLHRDIKPSNILMRDDHYIYVADFGLARIQQGGSDLTLAGTLLGTPEYMAPELAEGPATVSSDVYALAIVLYQMLSGKVPFRGETAISVFWKHVREQPLPPSHFNPALPTAVDKVLMRALAKDPRVRYDTPLALSQAYQEAIIGLEPMPDLYDTEMIKEDLPVPPVVPLANAGEPVKLQPLPKSPETPRLPLAPTPPPQSRRSVTPPPRNLAARPVYEQTTDVIASEVNTQYAPRRRRRGNKVLGGIVIGLVFLLIVSGILALLTFQGRQQGSVAATAQARNDATATIVANQTQGAMTKQQAGTATAQAQAAQTATTTAESAQEQATQAAATKAAATATAQVQAQAQATSTAIAATATAITGSTPLAVDPLTSQDRNNWEDNGLSCQFTNNTYAASVNSTNAFQPCISHNLHYDDAAIQVEATLISGDDAGIIFRSNADATQFYDFEITSDGHFFLRYRNDGKYTTLIKETANRAILGKGNSNSLFVISKGNDFQLFVNGTFLGEVHDSTFGNGQIGLAAGTNSSNKGEAVFANLNIYQP